MTIIPDTTTKGIHSMSFVVVKEGPLVIKKVASLLSILKTPIRELRLFFRDFARPGHNSGKRSSL